MKTALSIGGLIAVAAAQASAGRQIDYASTPVSNNYTSSGVASPLDGDFVFELGAFDASGGWVPTPANTAEWAARWSAVGRLSYNPSTRWFTGSAELGSNAAPFAEGGAAYIWGFDTAGEWILLKNAGWQWPAASGGPSLPRTFAVADPGTVAVVGVVSPDGSAGYQMMTAKAGGEIPRVDPELWRRQHFTAAERADPAVSAWGEDPDGDGEGNLAELAAGTDPKDASSTRRPSFDFIELPGGLHVQMELLRSGKAEIGHALARSTDLTTWDESGTSVTVLEDSATRLLLRSLLPARSRSREFYQFRLRAP